MVFVTCLGLRARQRFPTCAVDRLYREKVVSADLRYGATENGGAIRPLAEFPCNSRREHRIRLLPHQLQCVLHLLVRDNTQEGRLLKLYRKALPQGSIKHGIARAVAEVGKDNGVSIRQRMGFPGEP